MNKLNMQNLILKNMKNLFLYYWYVEYFDLIFFLMDKYAIPVLATNTAMYIF